MKQRHKKVVDIFLSDAEKIDLRDKGALERTKAEAIEKSGFKGSLCPKDPAKRAAMFDQIWKNPHTSQYVADLWGFALDEPEPLTRYAKRLDELAMQTESPKLALESIKFIVTTLLPPKVSRIQAEHLHGHLSDPPASYDQSPKMVATAVISAEQKALRASVDPPETYDGDEDE